jgi:hypothetical protein
LMAHSCHWIDHQMEATICSYYSFILFCLHSRPWPGCLFIWPLYSEYGIHNAPIRRKCTLFSPMKLAPFPFRLVRRKCTPFLFPTRG